LSSKMTRTMWIALFCLVGLGPAIAIKVVNRPASLPVEAAPALELALVPNEAAKSDRLPLPAMRAEAEVGPASSPQPETQPADADGTVKSPGRHWRDANAKALSDEVDTDESTSHPQADLPSRLNRGARHDRAIPSERPHRHAIGKGPVENAGNSPSRPREPWRCRQDTMGSVLRSLDLAPKCSM
jgi:hypothetical protein